MTFTSCNPVLQFISLQRKESLGNPAGPGWSEKRKRDWKYCSLATSCRHMFVSQMKEYINDINAGKLPHSRKQGWALQLSPWVLIWAPSVGGGWTCHRYMRMPFQKRWCVCPGRLLSWYCRARSSYRRAVCWYEGASDGSLWAYPGTS